MRYLFLFAFVAALGSCAPSRFVKPLEAKQQAVNLSLGGALIEYSGLTIPMPLVTATYGYGLDSTLTGFASLHLTSALYGNLQTEFGVTKRILQQKGKLPAVSISPVANIIYRNKNAAKFYPQADVNAYWDFNQHRNYFYVGLSSWFELSGKRAFDEEQPHHWLFSPLVGQTFSRKKWDFTIEAKVIAPNVPDDKMVVDYKTPFSKHGAFGIYFAYTRKFK
jgi:hypothetical protein